MLLSDDDTRFRPCPLESIDDVAGFATSNDTPTTRDLLRSRKATIERTRQLLNQNIEQKKNILSLGRGCYGKTISQDYAEGESVLLDKQLQLLRGSEVAWTVRFDDLEPQEIEEIKRKWSALEQQQHGCRTNRALQDYQMQLMLLEQQNKRRLLMATSDETKEKQRLRRITGRTFLDFEGTKVVGRFQNVSHTGPSSEVQEEDPANGISQQQTHCAITGASPRG